MDFLKFKKRILAACAAFVAAAVIMPATSVITVLAETETSVITDNRDMESWPSGLAPSINAEAAYVLEINSDTVVYSKNPDTNLYPASITKVLTSLIVIENSSLDDTITFEYDDVYGLEEGGSNYAMNWEGETLTVRDALYAFLLESVNECGMALARHVAGSIEAFAAMMNEKAAQLGCTGSNFVNPHGLNDPNHYTTAHDMALIFEACVQNETFREIDGTTSYKIAGTTQNPQGMTCTMHHQMMQEGSSYYSADVKCGKTGYTSLAGNTLVSYAEMGNKKLVITILKDSGAANSYVDTQTLMDYSNDNFTLVDTASAADGLVDALKAVCPFDLTIDGCSFVFVPNSDATGITCAFNTIQDSTDGAIGRIVYSTSEKVLASGTLRLKTESVESSAALEAQSSSGSTSAASSLTAAEGAESAAVTQSDGGLQSDGDQGITLSPRFIISAIIAIAAAAGIVVLVVSARMEEARRRESRRRKRDYRN